MKPSVVPFLACIHCKGNLNLAETESTPSPGPEGREIISGTLTCLSCTKQYSIRRGIPRMIDEDLSSATDLNTGDRFGDAWKEFPRLDYGYNQQFFDWIYPVDSDYFKGKVVLEAGCGKGRHAKIAVESQSQMVFAIDIGDAIEVAFQNVGHLPNLHLIQADIRQLPFKKIFDFAFSVGVLHHMDDPQAGFTSLVNCLKDDGSVSIWVYGKENNWWITNLVSPLREAFSSKLDTTSLKILSTTLSIIVYLTAKLFVLPYANIRKTANWLPELFYESYLSYIGRFDFTEINHITFDHLIAPVAFYIPKHEVLDWFQSVGFSSPLLRWHNKNSWSGFASNVKSNKQQMDNKIRETAVAK